MTDSNILANQKQFLGHPIGLYILFLTEMWERFSYYGMRAILVLYLVSEDVGNNAGLGWSEKDAYILYGWYTMLVYVLSIPGGLLADKLLGQKKTVLLGGMRSLGISNNEHGIFTDDSNKLTNDYFATLLDMSVQWKPNGSSKSFEGIDRVSGEKIRTASRVDLAFGSNSQLRAIAEVYASSDAHDKFVKDFVSAWNKVMNIDIA